MVISLHRRRLTSYCEIIQTGMSVRAREDSSSSLVDFLLTVGQLKRTKRTGWVLCDVASPESVSDHMYRMSIIAMAVSTAQERDHAMKMALAHDLAESLVGDITPHCGVSADEKFRQEEAAMAEIRDGLSGNPVGQELYDLWHEYEKSETATAVLMKDIDKFEMILTAYEYEKAQGLDLSEFFESTAGKFRTPQIQALVRDLYVRRGDKSGNS